MPPMLMFLPRASQGPIETTLWDKLVTLINFTGINGSTPVSAKGDALVVQGVTASNEVPIHGMSGKVPSTTSYIDTVSRALGAEWTVGGVFRPNSVSGYQYLFTVGGSGAGRVSVFLTNGLLEAYTGRYFSSSYSLSAGASTSVYAVKKNNLITIYANGAPVINITTTHGYTDETPIRFFADSGAGQRFRGYADEIIVSQEALWTEAFDPPGEIEVPEETDPLFHLVGAMWLFDEQSNGVTPSAVGNYPLTLNGCTINPSGGPFGDGCLVGGGKANYNAKAVSVNSSEDFCVDFLLRPGTDASGALAESCPFAYIYMIGNSAIRFYWDANGFYAIPYSFDPTKWYYIVAERVSGLLTFYIQGVPVHSAMDSRSYGTGAINLAFMNDSYGDGLGDARLGAWRFTRGARHNGAHPIPTRQFPTA